MFRTIVLGHDGTAGAAGATRFAAALARLTGARLVVGAAYPTNPLIIRLRTDFEERTRERAQVDLAVAQEDLGDVSHAVFETAAGSSPHAALHELAARVRADLLVVGTSRHPAAFVSKSPCAVALAPATGPARLARVGVACDGSSASRTALALARDLAEQPDTPVRQLDLVLVEPRGLRYHLELQDPGLFVRERSAAVSWLEHATHEPAGRARVRSVRRLGDAAGELVALSSELDLLVMGSRSRGPTRRLLLGSVSTRVAREAHCPVMIAPRLLREVPSGHPADPHIEVLAVDELRRLRRRERR